MSKIKPQRYSQIFKLIEEHKPSKFMEIGTWNGDNAVKMINYAKNFTQETITYLGFDLFEYFNKSKTEFCPKKPANWRLVYNKLYKHTKHVFLVIGDTRDTLKQNSDLIFTNNIYFPLDFIFIDGGHSLETIQNDWNYCRNFYGNKNTVFLFDDYYHERTLSLQYGCKQLIESLDKTIFNVEHLPIVDKCNNGTSMVKVTYKNEQG